MVRGLSIQFANVFGPLFRVTLFVLLLFSATISAAQSGEFFAKPFMIIQSNISGAMDMESDGGAFEGNVFFTENASFMQEMAEDLGASQQILALGNQDTARYSTSHDVSAVGVNSLSASDVSYELGPKELLISGWYEDTTTGGGSSTAGVAATFIAVTVEVKQRSRVYIHGCDLFENELFQGAEDFFKFEDYCTYILDPKTLPAPDETLNDIRTALTGEEDAEFANPDPATFAISNEAHSGLTAQYALTNEHGRKEFSIRITGETQEFCATAGDLQVVIPIGGDRGFFLSFLGEVAEERIERDFCEQWDCQPFGKPFTEEYDFFDTNKLGAEDLILFLVGFNKHLTGQDIKWLKKHKPKRPDIMRHSAPIWQYYEIKPNSRKGKEQLKNKLDAIDEYILELALPYLRGTFYTPKEKLDFGSANVEGVPLDLYLKPQLRSFGGIVYEYCMSGELDEASSRLRDKFGKLALLFTLIGIIIPELDPYPDPKPEPIPVGE